MNKRLKIIIGFGILLLIICLIYFQGSINKNKNLSQQITPVKPKVQGGLEGNYLDKVTFQDIEVKFPEELPFLRLVPKELNQDYISEIKSSLGINYELDSFNDKKEGIKYFTTFNNHFLFITPRTSKIKYGLYVDDFSNTRDLNLSDTDLEKIANDFILNNSLNINDTLKPSRISYLKKASRSEGLEQTSRDEATIFQINYSPISSLEYKIVNSLISIPNSSFISLFIASSGDSFNSIFPPKNPYSSPHLLIFFLSWIKMLPFAS